MSSQCNRTTVLGVKPTRRQFLVLGAATGAAVLLNACSDDAGSSPSSEPGTLDGTDLPEEFSIVQRFPNHPLFVPGEESRLPIGIIQGQGLRDNGPAELTGWIEDFNGERITDVVGRLRRDGMSVAYWEVRAELPKAVVYTLRLDGDDGYGATFELFDPDDVSTPLTGSPMPPFDTPTTDDPRGVDPICSLAPEPCPFHSLTLTEALAAGKPVAYLVGTPGHCQTGTCTPGLQFLMEEAERVGDALVCVHADVYADAEATIVAPAVEALDVQYEPIIYFIDAGGTIVDRLDAIWDRSELRERIDLLLG